MAGYVDLASIHTPAANVAPPAAWGLQVRDNQDVLAHPYACRVRRTTAQSIPTATSTALLWDTKDYDTSPNGNMWVAGAPGNLVAPVAGKYRATFSGQFSINATGARILFWILNTVVKGTFHGSGNATWYVGGTVDFEAAMAAGDVLSAYAYQASGAALNIDMAYEVWATLRLVSW